MWNQSDKGELEAAREQTLIDDIVQKAHIERELLDSLGGIETAFDGFSIQKVKKGTAQDRKCLKCSPSI